MRVKTKWVEGKLRLITRGIITDLTKEEAYEHYADMKKKVEGMGFATLKKHDERLDRIEKALRKLRK